MIRCLAYAFTAIFKSRASLVAENLCLRQQMVVLKRRVCGKFLFVADICEISRPNQLGIAATILPQCERYPT